MNKWEDLRQWILEYAHKHEEHQPVYRDLPYTMGYCVAISCADLLDKMEELDIKEYKESDK